LLKLPLFLPLQGKLNSKKSLLGQQTVLHLLLGFINYIGAATFQVLNIS